MITDREHDGTPPPITVERSKNRIDRDSWSRRMSLPDALDEMLDEWDALELIRERNGTR